MSEPRYAPLSAADRRELAKAANAIKASDDLMDANVLLAARVHALEEALREARTNWLSAEGGRVIDALLRTPSPAPIQSPK